MICLMPPPSASWVVSSILHVTARLKTCSISLGTLPFGTLNAEIGSSDTIFLWMAEWSAGLITRCVKAKQAESRTERLGDNDAQAPIAEFGEKIMYMTSRNTSKSAPDVDAMFHDGTWLGPRTKR